MDDVGLRSSAFRSLTGNGHAPSPGPVLRIRLQPPRAESIISQSNYNQKRRPHQSERTLPFLRVQLRNNPAAQLAPIPIKGGYPAYPSLFLPSQTQAAMQKHLVTNYMVALVGALNMVYNG